MTQTVTSTRLSRGLAATALVGLVTLAACGTVPGQPAGQDPPTQGTGATTTGPRSNGGGSNTPSAKPTPEAVKLTPSVSDGASGVKVSTLVSVAAANGTLATVSLSSVQKAKDGTSKTVSVDGDLNSAKTSWKASEALDPGSNYTLKMSGKNSAGTSRSSSTTFTTQSLSLSRQTYPTVFPNSGATVGVGMPVVLTFDVPVTDRANFEKHLSVSTSPKQTGSWHWLSNREVHYRPQNYWKPGTKVSVKGALNGVSAGNGIYGQNAIATHFTIGRSQVTKIDLRSDVGKVYRNGKLVRTIAVSGGKPGWETRSGVKLIMSKETNKRMTNEMIGAAEAYDLMVAYALRITDSGEFLHSAPWNAAYLGRVNHSHGCTGMSTADARWLYQTSLIGDPTITTGSSRSTDMGNGWADWNESWKQYQKGSAL